MGTDCPALSPQRIGEAAQALAEQDAVLIPATDGGKIFTSLIALILPGNYWAAIENKEEWRKCCQHPLINAARAVFKDPKKQISPHSLRHSYCIHLIDRGVSLDKVAKLIGDSIKTTEEYYTGFIVSDNEVDIVKKVIGQD